MPIYKTGKVKDGKQQYRVKFNYVDCNGNYKQLSRCVYGSAEAKFAEKELQNLASEREIPQKITVGQLYDEYIESKTYEMRESSLAKKQSILKNHILPFFEKTRLDKLNTPLLQRWKNSIAEQDKKIATKKNAYKEFSAMLNYAVKCDYLPSNPLLKIGNFKDAYNFEKHEDKIQYYTASEFRLFMASAANHLNNVIDYGYYTFFAIAFYTGMRKGEINALRWSDIDGHILSVNRSVTQKLKGKGNIFTPPKNASSARRLQLPQPLIDILSKQRSIQQENSNKWSENFLVCGGPDCLSDTGISNRNTQYASEAGLHRIRIHDFRHTHATLLINEGINIQEIARRLGHSDVNITWKVYSHLYPREEQRAIRVLESIKFGQNSGT